MLGSVVKRDVVVERGVNSACAQAVGDRDQAELPKGARKRKGEDSGGGKANGESAQPARAQFAHQPCGHERGYDGAARDDDRNRALGCDGCAQVEMHDRPGRAQQRIGQAKRDKGEVDDGDEKRGHRIPVQNLRDSGDLSDGGASAGCRLSCGGAAVS